jgi:hypothetical protein
VRSAVEMLKVIGLTRANNISIMLTRFADWAGDAHRMRAAVLSWAPLGVERLGLLIQVLFSCWNRLGLIYGHLTSRMSTHADNSFMCADGTDSGGGQEAGRMACGACK